MAAYLWVHDYVTHVTCRLTAYRQGAPDPTFVTSSMGLTFTITAMCED